MTGDEHYREAERLLEMAQYPQRILTGFDGDMQAAEQIRSEFGEGTVVFGEPIEIHDMTTAAAQVHATLALAAATARDYYGHAAVYGGIDQSAEAAS